MSELQPPMDWYPDPADPSRDRYWDGERWTHNTRARREATPASPPAAPVAAPVAGGQPSSGGATAAPRPDGRPAQTQPYPQQYPQGQPVDDPWAGQPQAGQPQPGQYPAQQGQFSQGQFPPGQYPVQQGQFQPQPYGGGQFQPVPSTPDGVPLAGWWHRVGAFVVDNIALSFLISLLTASWQSELQEGYMAWFTAAMKAAEAGQPMPGLETFSLIRPYLVVLGITTAVNFAYQLLMTKFLGATLGKMLLGIRVVPTGHGQAERGLGWGKALVRALVLVLTNTLTPVFWLSALFPLWTQKRQTFHDMAAGTQVVRTR